MWQAHNCAMIVRNIGGEGLYRDAIIFMLNSHFWLRPFLAAIIGVVLLSAPANAARDGSTDRPGLDYKTIELSAPNPDLCENACKKDGKCRAWTYSWPGAKGPKAMCALKTGVPPKRSDTCCISGVLSTTSPVTKTDDPAPAPAPKKPAVAEKPAPAPKKPAVAEKPAPAPAPEKPVVEAKPEPAPVPPKKPAVTAQPEPAPEPVPAPEKPVVVEKPEPEEPAVTAEPVPAPPPTPAPKKPVETVTPLPEKPANETVAEPVPAPLPPVDELDTATVPPTPRPNPRLLQEDEPEPQQETEPQQEIEPQQETEPRQETPPDPAKLAACNDYASRAIVQNGENNRLNCGLSGSRWGFGRNAYFSFCMRNPSSVYNAARAARDRDLDTCQRQQASRDGNRDEPVLPNLDDGEPDDVIADNSRRARFCRNFAGQSVRQARRARRYRCGFGGERWSRSRVRQERLCRRIGTRAATQLLNNRARQIANCRAAGRGGRPGRAACRDYARTAVAQARDARRLDCGYRGRRWSRNFQRHLRWCSSSSRRQVQREYRVRKRLLDQCE